MQAAVGEASCSPPHTNGTPRQRAAHGLQRTPSIPFTLQHAQDTPQLLPQPDAQGARVQAASSPLMWHRVAGHPLRIKKPRVVNEDFSRLFWFNSPRLMLRVFR